LRLRSAYPPGGVSDVVLRALASRLAARWAVAVVVEHLPGAGGTLAMASLARSKPDGHLLVFSATSPLTIAPHLAALRYDALTDVAPLSAVMVVPLLVAGTSALAAGTLAEALRQAAPLRWASSGVATTGHLALEAVRLVSGAPIVHVPYKGGGQQINDALSGQFELLSTNVATAQLALVQAGRLKALAVGAAAALPRLPQVPTLAQLGFAEANLASTFGLFAPGATPTALLQTMHRRIDAVIREGDWQRRLLEADNLPLAWSREHFAQHVREEFGERALLVRRLGPALGKTRERR
jgi:tripartite-type tricarboxylate transporter receptor subunit TctC